LAKSGEYFLDEIDYNVLRVVTTDNTDGSLPPPPPPYTDPNQVSGIDPYTLDALAQIQEYERRRAEQRKKDKVGLEKMMQLRQNLIASGAQSPPTPQELPSEAHKELMGIIIAHEIKAQAHADRLKHLSDQVTSLAGVGAISRGTFDMYIDEINSQRRKLAREAEARGNVKERLLTGQLPEHEARSLVLQIGGDAVNQAQQNINQVLGVADTGPKSVFLVIDRESDNSPCVVEVFGSRESAEEFVSEPEKSKQMQRLKFDFEDADADGRSNDKLVSVSFGDLMEVGHTRDEAINALLNTIKNCEIVEWVVA
jgi:hypothetical protein